MKFQLLAFLALAGVSIASPVLKERQTGPTSSELENGSCRAVTFIFARGSTESGNMGTIVGPQTCNSLKARLGASNVACQGVGGPYIADLASNFLPKGTSDAAIGEATRLVNLANTKCPSTKITVGGYSQGAAVMDNTLSGLPAAVKSKVVGAVLFGDTQFQQHNGQIPNYPPSQTKIFCAVGDLVCDGTLTITAAHLTYGANADEAASFLASKAA